MPNDIQWKPAREPLRATLARNGTIALVVGAVLAERMGVPHFLPADRKGGIACGAFRQLAAKRFGEELNRQLSWHALSSVCRHAR